MNERYYPSELRVLAAASRDAVARNMATEALQLMAERDDLRSENARMAAALDRIAGQKLVFECRRDKQLECSECLLPWPRALLPDDSDQFECVYCIARAAVGPVAGEGVTSE